VRVRRVVRLPDDLVRAPARSDSRSKDIAQLRLASRLLDGSAMSKKMFKVLCPMEGRNGIKYWSRLGTGFSNRDESINVYLDVIPFNKPNVTIQLREFTEEEQRRDAERRASSEASSGVSASLPTSAATETFTPTGPAPF
jgi:hypothetical protein